jgi:nucleotide-binding universal stress UspA family protein
MRVLVGYDGSDGAHDAIELTRVICTSPTDEALIVNVLPYGAALPLAYRAIGLSDSAEVRQFFGRPRSTLSGIEVQTGAFSGDSAAHVLTDLSCPVLVVPHQHRSIPREEG